MTTPWRASQRPIVRRDVDGVKQAAPSRAALTEQLIREAQEDGRFGDLPHQGKPSPMVDDSLAGDMTMAYHVLRDAGLVPPWVEADKEVQRRRSAVEDVDPTGAPRRVPVGRRLRATLGCLITEYDRAVSNLESSAPSPRQQGRRLDAAGARVRLEGAPASEPPRR